MSFCESNISRWTAPVCEIEFDRKTDFISKIRITFAQGYDENGKEIIVLEKTEKDCEFSDNIVRFNLSQEETLSFNENELVVIQVQIYDINGVPMISEKGIVGLNDVINEGVSW